MNFFRTKEYRFYEVLLLGLGLGFVLCLRPNMIGVWAVLTPAVLIALLKDRRFADLGRCALAYSLGLTIVLLPIYIWLRTVNLFSAFLECYIKFNFGYSGVDLTLANYLSSAVIMLCITPFLIPAIAFSLPLARHCREARIGLLSLAGSLALICISGRTYHHYALPLLPLLPMMLAMPLATFAAGDPAIRSPKLLPASCTALALCVLFSCAQESKVPTKDSDISPAVAYLRENTLPDDDVLVLNNYCEIYLQSDRYTRNRFIYQTQLIRTSDALYREFLNELRVHPSDVILIPDRSRAKALASDDYFTPIYQLFDDMYRSGELALEEYDGFYLYRRVQA